MNDFSFAHAGVVPPGPLVIRATNVGRVAHQLLLVKVPPGVRSLKEQLQGTRRRASHPVAFIPDRQPGQTGMFAVDLPAGRYGLVCFVPGPDGVPYALKGMSSEFRVRAA